MMEQSFRLRQPVLQNIYSTEDGSQPANSGQAMAGQANDKTQMSNKIQNPNVKMFSDMVSYLLLSFVLIR